MKILSITRSAVTLPRLPFATTVPQRGAATLIEDSLQFLVIAEKERDEAVLKVESVDVTFDRPDLFGGFASKVLGRLFSMSDLLPRRRAARCL